MLFLLFRVFLEKASLSATGVDMTAIGSYLGICLGGAIPFVLLAVTQRRTLDLVDLVKKDSPAGSLDFLAFSGFLLLAVMCLVSMILTGFFFYLEGLSALLGALVASQGVILFLFFVGEGWSRYRSPANGELSVMESMGE
ncbi:MAG: hypothetical protein HYU64_12210, partial [Armatimonadetes bacterium]|nr:hypothetical protein [Armatimonadota bacterium]